MEMAQEDSMPSFDPKTGWPPKIHDDNDGDDDDDDDGDDDDGGGEVMSI